MTFFFEDFFFHTLVLLFFSFSLFFFGFPMSPTLSDESTVRSQDLPRPPAARRAARGPRRRRSFGRLLPLGESTWVGVGGGFGVVKGGR